MDLREKKTRKHILNAFLQLRAKKPLEKITIRELAELAEISKATFYLHYRDIYDLSDSLQNELIQAVLHSIPHPEHFLSDPAQFTRDLCHSFYAQQSLIDILFSGNQSAVFPIRIEQELRRYLHKQIPHPDRTLDMRLTYQILGAYYVFQQYHKEHGVEETLRFIADIAKEHSIS